VPTDLPLRCACGAVHGLLRGVGPERGNRIVCYCDDCQAFAHYLGRAGEILDANGGTDIFQTSPARVAITGGADQLVCVRLTSKGLLRWYAGCCRTPIANTPPSAQLPFVGLIHRFADHAGDGRSRDAVLGPVRARLFGRYALGDRRGLNADDRPPVRMILRLAASLLAARLRGEHRASPFFDPRSGEPVAAPRVLGERERRPLTDRDHD
jgi:Family of unknown function (DUF6151)